MHGRERDIGIDAFHYLCVSLSFGLIVYRRMNGWNYVVQRTDDSVLELAGFVDVEELAGAQRKLHAFIILLQLIVDLRCDQGSQFPLREILIFVKSLAVSDVSKFAR